MPDKSDAQAAAEEELLRRLVELNTQRAAEEAQGTVRWLRPAFQAPEEYAAQTAQQDMGVAKRWLSQSGAAA